MDLKLVPIGKRIIDTLRQPDTNFTEFAVNSVAFVEFTNNSELLFKFFDPSFSGHVICYHQQKTYEYLILTPLLYLLYQRWPVLPHNHLSLVSASGS